MTSLELTTDIKHGRWLLRREGETDSTTEIILFSDLTLSIGLIKITLQQSTCWFPDLLRELTVENGLVK